MPLLVVLLLLLSCGGADPLVDLDPRPVCSCDPSAEVRACFVERDACTAGGHELDPACFVPCRREAYDRAAACARACGLLEDAERYSCRATCHGALDECVERAVAYHGNLGPECVEPERACLAACPSSSAPPSG